LFFVENVVAMEQHFQQTTSKYNIGGWTKGWFHKFESEGVIALEGGGGVNTVKKNI